MYEVPMTLNDIMQRCQNVLAHAWMVRTFVKHCDEVEDFPELMGIVRAVFDTSRALETRVDDPEAYVRMLTKKMSKLRRAADEFRNDAPVASSHTNFVQAVVSIDFCIAQLDELLESAAAIQSRNSPSGTAAPEDSSGNQDHS